MPGSRFCTRIDEDCDEDFELNNSAFAIIPAFNPPDALRSIAGSLKESTFTRVILIDDGSDASFRALFDELEALPHIEVLRHAANLGKGAGLRTGMNHALNLDPDCVGVVTLDADGQHLIGDVEKVAAALRKYPKDLILGARAGDGDIPLRSRVGNTLTRCLFRILAGQSLTDTQTGLRGIPLGFIPTLLHMTSPGYEFELEMLLSCRQSGRALREVPIETVYIDNNRQSHFNPILDSMRIYFVLFRFAGESHSGKEARK